MSVWQLCNKCSTEADASGWELLYQYEPGAWSCMTCADRAIKAWHETNNDELIKMGVIR